MSARRPKLPHLARLYDEGVAAAASGSACPYDPPTRHGDAIRTHFWRHGYEDAQLDLTVAALV